MKPRYIAAIVTSLMIAVLLRVTMASSAPVSQQQEVKRPPAPGTPTTRALVMRVKGLGNPTARALVIRRPVGASTQDIILVTGSTTPLDLSRAVGVLIQSRRSQGARVAAEVRAEISEVRHAGTRRSADELRAARDLARLASAREVSLPGVGRGRAIAISTRARAKP